MSEPGVDTVGGVVYETMPEGQILLWPHPHHDYRHDPVRVPTSLVAD